MKLSALVSFMFVTPFLAPNARPPVGLDYRVTTHDGRDTTLRALVDRPVAISFAYSRCTNPNKCPRVVNAMGVLSEALERVGLSDRVRLLLITYDPGYDTPVLLRGFAKLNGTRLDDTTLFLRPEPDVEHALFRSLGVTASFSDEGVAIHGIQLLLLDRHGRLVRTYRTLLWERDQVVRDLSELVAE